MEDETRRDNKSSMTVSRLSAHWVSDDTEAYTINIYPGSGNRLRLTRIYSTQWLCNYNMLYYPFDTQVSLKPLHTGTHHLADLSHHPAANRKLQNIHKAHRRSSQVLRTN